jgi:CDP-diacylglycerol--glycerol-3-phosphate 3-phosphatidyltransferase
MLKQLPNALTLSRLVLAPVIAWAVWMSFAAPQAPLLPGDPVPALTPPEGWSLAAALVFVIAALTDLFDGMLARALDAHSKFGRLIDPIADKALVGLPLIALSMIAIMKGLGGAWVIAAATGVIVARDILVTVLRLTSTDGEGVRVSQLAKWKTAVELIAVALPLITIAAPALAKLAGAPAFTIPYWLQLAQIFLLLLAAILSVWTASQYFARHR